MINKVYGEIPKERMEEILVIIKLANFHVTSHEDMTIQYVLHVHIANSFQGQVVRFNQ